MEPDKARKILDEGAEILDSLGCDWWLSAGTLLGAYREGLSDAFLEADTDIDVGVRGDRNYDNILTKFVLRGFRKFRSYQTNCMWSQLALEKDGVLFDIYFFNEEGEELVNHNEHGTMRKPASLFNNHTVEVDGTSYPCPDPEPYLVVRYGEDWKTPKGKVPWEQQAANLKRS